MNILLAIDGSMYSQAASRALATHVRPQGATVLVVHVIEPSTFWEQDAGLRERSQQAQALLNKAVHELDVAGFTGLATRVVRGRDENGNSGGRHAVACRY